MRPVRALFLALLATLAACAQPVVLLSLDALAAEAFTEARMPRLHALARGGQHGRVRPPSPSTTFNGHATLATGCWPEHHGIVANAYRDGEAWVAHSATAPQLQREPLWVAATRAGQRTAVFGWPCATGPWEGVCPWRLRPFDPRTDSPAHTLSEVDEALREGAQLVMAYLPGVDAVGHQAGPGSPAWVAELARIDRELAAWIAAQRARHPALRLVLTADHGMAAVTRRIDLAPLAGPETWRIQSHGRSAFLYLRPGASPEALLVRLARAGLRAWHRAELPTRFHLRHARVGEVVVAAPEGAWLSSGATEAARLQEARSRRGAHGSLEAEPALAGWLLVLGSSKKGEIPEVDLQDLAVTVSSWLGIAWARTPDGEIAPALQR